MRATELADGRVFGSILPSHVTTVWPPRPQLRTQGLTMTAPGCGWALSRRVAENRRSERSNAVQTSPTVEKPEITVEVVSGIIAEQFPRWSNLAIGHVELDGWDNTSFRLGEKCVSRPSGTRRRHVETRQRLGALEGSPHLPRRRPQRNDRSRRAAFRMANRRPFAHHGTDLTFDLTH